MPTIHRRTAAVAATVLLALGTVALAGAGRPRSARIDLPVAEGSPLPEASGKITVKTYPAVGKREERSWIRLQAKKLEKGGTYQMYVDDPTVEGEEMVAFGDPIPARGNGNINEMVDSKHGGGMPFEKTLDELGGAAFELRDGEGLVVLDGTLPTLPPAPVVE